MHPQKYILYFAVLIAFFVFVFTPVFYVRADDKVEPVNIKQDYVTALKSGSLIAGMKLPTVQSSIGVIVRQVLMYIGIATMVLIVYAGGLWAFARGNEQTIGKAKKILIGSVIGLIVVFSSAIIVNLVLSRIVAPGVGYSTQADK